MDVQPPRYLPSGFSGKQLHPRVGSQAEGSLPHAGNEDTESSMAVLALLDVEDVHLRRIMRAVLCSDCFALQANVFDGPENQTLPSR